MAAMRHRSENRTYDNAGYEGAGRLAREGGFDCLAQWVDREWPFAECFWRA